MRKDKNYSSNTFRVASVSAFVCGLIALVISILLLLIEPISGIFMTSFAVVCFVMCYKFKNKVNR